MNDEFYINIIKGLFREINRREDCIFWEDFYGEYDRNSPERGLLDKLSKEITEETEQ